jgi:hypothetical protein
LLALGGGDILSFDCSRYALTALQASGIVRQDAG